MTEYLNQENGLVLKHYKEPLKEVSKGFGYLGAVTCTIDGTKIQCHVCGGLYKNLAMHVNRAHRLNVKEYRKKFDLTHQTALISEAERELRKNVMLAMRASMPPEKRRELNKKNATNLLKWKKANKYKTFDKLRLETKNMRGSCPDQIAAKIKECALSIGHTPSKNEFFVYCNSQRYIHLAYRTFGSWKKAVAFADLENKKKKKGAVGKRYTDDELLEYLSIFYQESGKIPTETDCKRGLIPPSRSYVKRWGSFPAARLAAGIQENPAGRWALKSEQTMA